MRIVSRERLAKAEEAHKGSGSGKALAAWVRVAESPSWKHFPDVKRSWRSADYVQPYVVFKIKGTDFRLTATINYQMQTVAVERVQTHTEYTRKGP